MATGVLPALTCFSESLLSVIRGHNPTWHRAAPRGRGKARKTSRNGQGNTRAGDAQEHLNKLVTRALFHADLVQSGLMIDLLSLINTTNTATAPQVISPKHYQTLLTTEHYLTTEISKLEKRDRSTSHRHLLNTRLICPKLNLSHPHHRTLAFYSKVPNPNRYSIPTGPRTTGSRATGPGWSWPWAVSADALEQLATHRAMYEKTGSPSYEERSARAQSHIRLRYSVERMLPGRDIIESLRHIADEEPRNAHAQTLYLLAVHCIQGESARRVIQHRVESLQYALNPVIIGLYQDALGLRKGISKKSTPSSFHLYFEAMVKVIFVVFLVAVMYSIFRKDGSIGTSGTLNSLLGDEDGYDVTSPTLTFEDVAGNNHAIQEMEELVSYLTEPSTYTDMGCQIPKGYLLCGPPGVGKTLLAKALAGEAAVPFYYASGSGFEEIFVGVGAGRVRRLFEEAQANAPSIIFIDEIDSIGQKRKKNEYGYSNRATLNQMLSAMDGFDDNNGVIVIAATNEPETLDAALMREGRFDTKIAIRPPTAKGRLEILKVHTRNKILDEKVDLENLASACVGMTGAQLATLANTAALRVVLEDREEITQDDLEYARARLLIGHVNEDVTISDKELLNTAAHEAGHAIITLLREEITQRHLYVATVQPRGQTLGHVMPVSTTDQHTQDVASLIAQIDICLAGRIGEELHSNFEKDKVTTGCSSDMQSATYYGEQLIKTLGYSSKIGFTSGNEEKNDLTDKIVHDELKQLFNERYQVVKADLLRYRAQWKRLTDLLVEYETLTGGEVKAILEGGSPDREPGESLPPC